MHLGRMPMTPLFTGLERLNLSRVNVERSTVAGRRGLTRTSRIAQRGPYRLKFKRIRAREYTRNCCGSAYFGVRGCDWSQTAEAAIAKSRRRGPLDRGPRRGSAHVVTRVWFGRVTSPMRLFSSRRGELEPP